MRSYKTIIMLIGLLFVFSGSTFANPNLSSLQTSKHQSTEQKKLKSSYYTTEILIINNSRQEITVKVPGTDINDLLYPHQVEDIYSNDYFDGFEVVLYDDAGYEFFRDFVPNHSKIIVDDNLLRGTAGAGKENKSKVRASIQK